MRKTIYCPRCKGKDIIDKYINKPKEGVSMDDLGDRYLEYTMDVLYYYTKRATCTDCGYSITYQVAEGP